MDIRALLDYTVELKLEASSLIDMLIKKQNKLSNKNAHNKNPY